MYLCLSGWCIYTMYYNGANLFMSEMCIICQSCVAWHLYMIVRSMDHLLVGFAFFELDHKHGLLTSISSIPASYLSRS